ncbi:MAG: hypothetical protein JOZ14_05765 [Acidobacteria bacterium]|nr:hypothetical protein [Acidobacteriota bacterium]
MPRRAALAAMIVLTTLARGQTPPQQTTPAQQPATAQPTPGGRAPVRAKTQEEYQAYQSAVNSPTADAMEKAANDFATKFADSELRVLLYRAVMRSYQKEGQAQKMLDAGLKVLSIDKDDPEALIGVAEVQEEHTSPTDLDRAQRMDQAVANAEHALQTIDSDLTVPAGVPPDKVEAYKKYLRATAFAIVGTIQYKREQYPEAETTLRKAIDADTNNPDPVVILRLALALDQEKNYADALKQAQRAVELTQEDSEVGKMARTERDRLVIQTGGSNSPGTATSPANAPQNPAPPPR